MSAQEVHENDGQDPDSEYRWDVAISVLDRDEPLARELKNSLIERGYSVFLYCDEQSEISGKDSLTAFYQPFRHESRAVVVLYRPPWGTTKPTMVEENAIRDRLPEQRPENFLLVITLDGSKPDFDWLDPRIIYTDFPKYGIEVAAGAVAMTAQSAGAKRRPETAVDLAGRKARRRDWKRNSVILLRSREGMSKVEEEREIVFEEIQTIVTKAREKGWELSFKRETQWPAVNVSGERHRLTVSWQPVFYGGENRNSLWGRVVRFPTAIETIDHGDDPDTVEDGNYLIYVTPNMEIRWREEDKPEIFTSRELADHVMKKLVAQIEV